VTVGVRISSRLPVLAGRRTLHLRLDDTHIPKPQTIRIEAGVDAVCIVCWSFQLQKTDQVCRTSGLARESTKKTALWICAAMKMDTRTRLFHRATGVLHMLRVCSS